MSKYRCLSGFFGEPFLLCMVLLSIPLSIVVAEAFGVIFLLSYVFNGRWKRFSLSLLNISVLFIIFINYLSLAFVYPSGNSVSDASESLYLLFIPLVSSLKMSERQYLELLKYFIYGQLINACFGVIEALGVPVINTYGQGHLGLVNFHIWSSMMLALSLLILSYDYIMKKLFSWRVRSFFVLFLLWQMLTTTGRTGQAVFAVGASLIFFWAMPRLKVFAAIFSVFILAAISLLSKTARDIWISAYLQVLEFVHGGSAVTSIGLRLLYAKATWIMFHRNPLFGIGVGQFREYFYMLVSHGMLPYVPQSVAGVVGPTSSYLFYASEFGIAGIIALLSFFIFVFIKARRADSFSYKRVSYLLLVWMTVGSFSDVIIATWCLIVPFAVLVAAEPSVS